MSFKAIKASGDPLEFINNNKIKRHDNGWFDNITSDFHFPKNILSIYINELFFSCLMLVIPTISLSKSINYMQLIGDNKTSFKNDIFTSERIYVIIRNHYCIIQGNINQGRYYLFIYHNFILSDFVSGIWICRITFKNKVMEAWSCFIQIIDQILLLDIVISWLYYCKNCY